MTDSEFELWWQLHIRNARGEALSEAEQIIYHAGVDKLDQEEAEQWQLPSLANLRHLRTQLQLLTQNFAQLTMLNEQLNRRIAALEQTYQQLTGYQLTVDAHATR